MAKFWFNEKERGSTSLLKLMRTLALCLGRQYTSWLLPPITLYYFIRAAAGRRGLRKYYSLLGLPSGNALIFQHYLRFAHTVLDRVYLFGFHPDAPPLKIRGWEPIQEERKRGRGCILLGAHLGSFEAVRAAGIEQPGLKIKAIISEQQSQKINRTLAYLNPDVRTTTIPIGGIDSLLQLRDTLADGGLVGIMGDRIWRNEATYHGHFLGRKTLFPQSPLRLAAALRAPVFFFSGLYRTDVDGSAYYDVAFERLSASASEAISRQQWIDDLGKKYVSTLERHCLIEPGNWFNFYDFWSHPTPTNKNYIDNLLSSRGTPGLRAAEVTASEQSPYQSRGPV